MNDDTKLCHKTIETPLGGLIAEADEYGVRRILLPGQAGYVTGTEADSLPYRIESQILAYFSGELRDFSLPLSLIGSPFSLRVWQACLAVEYGDTISYGELARRLGMSGAARAVGAALARNPVPILIPCHRVVAGNGALTGYAGGLDVKKWLLDFEGQGCDFSL